MKRFYLPFVLCLLLVACQTPYARQGDLLNGNAFLGGNYGYDDKALAGGRYQILYRGNTKWDVPLLLCERLFYRAAQISLAQHHSHFTVHAFRVSTHDHPQDWVCHGLRAEPTDAHSHDGAGDAELELVITPFTPPALNAHTPVFDAYQTLHTGEGSYLFPAGR